MQKNQPQARYKLFIPNKISREQIVKNYSYASKYYTKVNANKQEQNFISYLQLLLRNNRKFVDNPNISQHNYIHAQRIFNNNQYYVFGTENQIKSCQAKEKLDYKKLIGSPDIIFPQGKKIPYLVAFSSFAHSDPQFIYDQFLFLKNPAGFYAIQLFVEGIPQYIVTSDHFPCQQLTNQTQNPTPAYAKVNSNKIWVLLLQKCFAKVYKSYEAIKDISQDQTYRTLACLSISNIHFRSANKLTYFNPDSNEFKSTNYFFKTQKLRIIRLKVQVQGSYYMSIYQKNKLAELNKKYEYSKITYEIYSLAGSQKIPLSSESNDNNCISWTCKLKSGQYDMSVKVSWNNQQFPLVFNTVGPKNVFFELIPDNKNS